MLLIFVLVILTIVKLVYFYISTTCWYTYRNAHTATYCLKFLRIPLYHEGGYCRRFPSPEYRGFFTTKLDDDMTTDRTAVFLSAFLPTFPTCFFTLLLFIPFYFILVLRLLEFPYVYYKTLCYLEEVERNILNVALRWTI